MMDHSTPPRPCRLVARGVSLLACLMAGPVSMVIADGRRVGPRPRSRHWHAVAAMLRSSGPKAPRQAGDPWWWYFRVHDPDSKTLLAQLREAVP